MSYLTIGSLRKIIKDMPDDAKIVLQSDAEGNSFRYARGADLDGVVVTQHAWNPDIYNSNWDNIDADMDEDEWNKLLTKPWVLVIHPVN